MVSNTGWISFGEIEMTRRTSAVAACSSRASTSSRVSRTTSASGPEADELLWRAAFGALPLFSANVFRRRVLTGSPPALERRLIAYPWLRTRYRSGSNFSTLEVAGLWLQALVVEPSVMSATGQSRSCHDVHVT